MPRDMHWNFALSEAIAIETGSDPYLIQTEAQRAAIGNPGELRIMDVHGEFGT